jgi:hypothetical protein
MAGGTRDDLQMNLAKKSRRSTPPVFNTHILEHICIHSTSDLVQIYLDTLEQSRRGLFEPLSLKLQQPIRLILESLLL